MANKSKEKRDNMLSFLDSLKNEYFASDEKIRAINEIENFLNEKKYGLVWEQHTEEVDDKLKEFIPVFKEDKTKCIVGDPGSREYNFLLEGDNLQSLYLLEKTHQGRIDLIYIDPPYNTGNRDFVYSDAMVEREDGYRHSKWISFMATRLRAARRLLSDTGALFISIDDNEIANLRLLCDSIFGEENFVSQITLLCNPKGRSQDKYFATCHEYLLVYSKKPLPRGSFSIDKTNDKIEKDYKLEDSAGKYRLLELRNTHREFDRNNRPNLYYPLFVDESCPKGSTVTLAPDETHTLPVYPIWKDGHDGCWTWGKPLVEKDIHLLLGKKSGQSWKIYRKSYAASKTGEVAKQKMFSIWREPEYYTEKGQAEFGRIFLGSSKNDFPQPKSVEYIKAIVRTMQNKDGIVLDFFAGSGTTAQAVLELNKEDGGNRRFIMCTNNEVSEEKEISYFVSKKLFEKQPRKGTKEAEAWRERWAAFLESDVYQRSIGTDDYRDMGICCGITFPRINTVITGKRIDGTQYSTGIPANLKYYVCCWTDRFPEEYFLSDALSLHVREMIELKTMSAVDGVHQALLLTKDEFNTCMNRGPLLEMETIWIRGGLLVKLSVEDRQELEQYHYVVVPEEFFSLELREVAE